MKALIPAIIVIATIVGIFYFVQKSPNKNFMDLNPQSSNSSQQASQSAQPTANVATIELDKGGVVKIKLNPQAAPGTVRNFIAKANAGYYDGLSFHRVEDWVVQGGDPLGNGTGGGNQPTELSQVPFKLGAVGIARGGDIKVSNDSQFFIVKKDSDFLDGQYTNFGQVTEGMDVVNQIQIGDKIRHIRVQ